jgi:glycosyltransferase involved in cell wall biosynthesis
VVDRPGRVTSQSRADHGRTPLRVAYLSYSSGIYDARTFRMARSAIEAGAEVTVYARWQPGLPLVEQHDGFRLVRAPWAWQLAIPGAERLLGKWIRGVPPRGWERARLSVVAAPPALLSADDEVASTDDATGGEAADPGTEGARSAGAHTHPQPGRSRSSIPRRIARRFFIRPARGAWQAARQPFQLLEKYPARPLAWARAVERVAEPADIWHGMWAGSLPALDRLRRRFGGRTVYDSRDVYMESRDLATAPRIVRPMMRAFERRWARRADLVITVNHPYAELLSRAFDIPVPWIVMNCPEAWTPPTPPPDRIREALGLPGSTPVVLYQGQLISDRGIEQAMDAILDVPGATLVLIGYGPLRRRLRRRSEEPPYAGRVRVVPAVHPSELVPWTASADVVVMPIQPTSLNHRYTTPQKLFESIAAGVPVVASDLPAMAEVVREIDAGALCDPTSPPSIAAAIREVLGVDDATRAARRERILAAAHARYNWAAQVHVLHAAYRDLLAGRTRGPA